MRCQVMGSYDSPPSYPGRWTSSNRHDVRNAHANIVLAVGFQYLALRPAGTFGRNDSNNLHKNSTPNLPRRPQVAPNNLCRGCGFDCS
ncbi:hypothetical protein PGTUg99_000607 [Puccinia graminis f. sp. tritici]|uniref:Uncharacterized protein n=1 Tax=Puccinia graminis f. sp. tritici TaxID=56615 RepID=A0A5B0RY11_PUCGR|nr:hypothetical protein PGTUg99_000607 [Puccinia graminis f. sp. tritici]